jgi:hypothetical protein
VASLKPPRVQRDRRDSHEPRSYRSRRGAGSDSELLSSAARDHITGYPRATMPDRLPPPGPSFLREHEIRVRDRRVLAGMSRPTTTDDGWWLAILWVADDDGIVVFRDLAPAAGPPADPPLARLGPALAGSLSGMILEEAGRLSIRIATVVPADDPSRPWKVPAAVRAAFKWEPMRAAAMRPNELADAVLAGFRRSIEGLGRP